MNININLDSFATPQPNIYPNDVYVNNSAHTEFRHAPHSSEQKINVQVKTLVIADQQVIELDSESIYSIQGYPFDITVEENERNPSFIHVLVKMYQTSLSFHKKHFYEITKGTPYAGIDIPDRSEKELFEDIKAYLSNE